MVQTVRLTMDIPQLLITLLRGPAVLECTRGGDSRAPMVALVVVFVVWGSLSSR